MSFGSSPLQRQSQWGIKRDEHIRKLLEAARSKKLRDGDRSVLESPSPIRSPERYSAWIEFHEPTKTFRPDYEQIRADMKLEKVLEHARWKSRTGKDPGTRVWGK